MDLGIDGRKAIVCASSRGLGRGCALALAQAGCEVVINGRDGKTLDATAAALREATGAATPAQALSATQAGHLSPAAGARGEAGLKYATPSQTNLDSNSVDMVAMIAAARQFEAQMKMLQTAEKDEQSAGQLLSLG